MNYKLIFGFSATVLALLSFFPYLKSILEKKTKPHIYSWLVWSIIQSVGVLAMLKGGASFGAWGLALGSLLCITIFLMSFKYGTKNITKLDTFLLIMALMTIVVWLIEKNPLNAVILVTIIDFIGYLPTYRKTYYAPESENLTSYYLWIASNILAIIAIANYSLVTTLYIGSLMITDTALVLIVLLKKKK